MPDYTLPSELNQSGGIENLFGFITINVENFMVVLFVFIFFLIVASGYSFQKRTTGRSEVWMWFAIGSFIVTILGVIISLIPLEPPIFPIEYVIISIAISILMMMGFFFNTVFSGN